MIHTGYPLQKCVHTVTADSSILKVKCILINTAFIIIQSMCVHFFETLYIPNTFKRASYKRIHIAQTPCNLFTDTPVYG